MASTDRRSTRDLIAEISEDGPRFRFFQAIRLLALSSGKKNGTRGAIPPALRFATPLTLSFQASEINNVQARLPLLQAPSFEGSHRDEEEVDRLALQVTVGFMGLTGPSGVLPTAYTELLMERKNFYRDTSAHGFLELFSHRAVSLFTSRGASTGFILVTKQATGTASAETFSISSEWDSRPCNRDSKSRAAFLICSLPISPACCRKSRYRPPIWPLH